MTIGIYRFYNKVTGRSYVGQSKNIEKRIEQHISRLVHLPSNAYGAHLKMYEDYKQYGLDSFDYEILEECTPDQLDDREGYWAYKYDVFNPEKGYNCDPSGMPSYRKYVELFKTDEERQKEKEEAIYRGYKWFCSEKNFNNLSSPLAVFGYAKEYLDVPWRMLDNIKIVDKCLKKECGNSPVNLQLLEHIESLIKEYEELEKKLKQTKENIIKELGNMVGISNEESAF